MADDPGVMGNLPRSRPGRRSEKRSTGASAGAAPRAGGGAPAKGDAAPTARKASPGRAPTTTSRAERGAARPAASGQDPVGDALKVAGKLAGAGLGIAVEVLRRLPRP